MLMPPLEPSYQPHEVFFSFLERYRSEKDWLSWRVEITDLIDSLRSMCDIWLFACTRPFGLRWARALRRVPTRRVVRRSPYGHSGDRGISTNPGLVGADSAVCCEYSDGDEDVEGSCAGDEPSSALRFRVWENCGSFGITSGGNGGRLLG